MWSCPKCTRIFNKASQPHSCRRVLLEEHFKNKEKAREIFDYLVKKINMEIGPCKIVSIPCCIHLFGNYDFLAALPKKDKLEVRFALDRQLNTPRLRICIPMSAKVFKNCFDVCTKEEIDNEFINWLQESYHLKDKNRSKISKFRK
jgi:hypothetical protein